jgi:predicted NAD-dependent protein-ADP-ribosyltransferase YbiA (DUF1768 family)
MLFTSKYFPKGAESMQRILLPVACIQAIAEMKPKMACFHDGIEDDDKLHVEEKGKLKITRSAEHLERMIAFVTSEKSKSGLIPFGRKGLTNFAETEVQLLSAEEVKKIAPSAVDPIRVCCSEQIFKLLCASVHRGDPNFEKVVTNILAAAKPTVAKKATGELDKFNNELWDQISKQAMYIATLLRCTHKPVFEEYKRCIRMMKGVESFLVIEANDDKIWGINRFTIDFLAALAEAYDGEEDLIAAAAAHFGGKNFLGEVLTDFMMAIRDMEYDDYMRELEGVQFVEIVSSE